ncbi:MAG TPA: hypothetical protein VES73_15110, partial [Lamprocystis sp. (in: g-proteobacteria)]|nr:hypothetical protein [Lamprocystis sp. (in: g-proteobacteria)]
ATAQQQARFRSKDDKQLIQVRLTPAAVEVLDRLVTVRQANGRAAILESILAAPSARDVLTLAARHLKQSGATDIHGTDSEGYVVEVRRHPPRRTAATWCP